MSRPKNRARIRDRAIHTYTEWHLARIVLLLTRTLQRPERVWEVLPEDDEHFVNQKPNWNGGYHIYILGHGFGARTMRSRHDAIVLWTICVLDEVV